MGVCISCSICIREHIFDDVEDGQYMGESIELENKIVKHGKGILIYPNGDKFDGNWDKNKKQGIGKLIFKEGKYNAFEGEWDDDIINDVGKLIFRDGDIFEGTIKNMEPMKGRIYSFSGEVFEGDFKDHQRHEGKIVFINKNVFEGTLNNNKMSNGKMSYSNNDIYEGDWINDKKNGWGWMIYSNGDTYEGDWHNDQKNGFGVFGNKYIIYTGEWNNDQKNGQGMLTCKDEIKEEINDEINKEFTGIFKNNKCESGKGVYYFEEKKEIYDGIIKNYKYEGKGKLYKSNMTMKGNFINGILEGYGTEKNSNGSIYKGYFIHNQKHGYGWITSDNEKWNGIWEKDKVMIKSTSLLNYGKHQCSICCGDFDYYKLYPICNNKCCESIACYDCIKNYFSKFKKGCYLNDSSLLCIYCRNIFNKHILKIMILGLLEITTIDHITRNTGGKKILGWCDHCNKLDSIEMKECRMDESTTPHLCSNCDIACVKKILKIKHCPKCNEAVTRTDSRHESGCHFMTCRNCRNNWCWFCEKNLSPMHVWDCNLCGK